MSQGLTDLERLRAEARVIPSRNYPFRGGGWEQHRSVGCSASRSGSIEEGTGCVVGENQPIAIDGHVNARDHRVSFQSNGRSHRRSRRKEKMRRRTFHNRQICVVRKRISMYGIGGVRVGKASNPGPGRAQRRRRVSSSCADTECDPKLLDDFARDPWG